jgi:hypothetical protein
MSGLAATGWMGEAACRRIPDLPWTAEPGTAPVVLGELMADVCAMCPVRDACTAYVDREPITGGYWAGAHRTATEVWVQDTLPLDNLPLDGVA